MKTTNHLPMYPSVPELMEVAYNEGVEGNVLMSAELERIIEETYPDNNHVWQRINDAHCNGWADYRAEVGSMNNLTIMAERFETVARLHQLTQAAFETLEDLNVEDLALLNHVNGAILIGALHPVWADDQSLTFFEEAAPALYEFLAEHVQIMGA